MPNITSEGILAFHILLLYYLKDIRIEKEVTMKKMMVCCMIFLSGILLTTSSFGTARGTLSGWSLRRSWQFNCQPVDFSQSLDKKWVFILGNDHKVHIYSANGDKKGHIPVTEGTVAIDIAPRGEKLYVVDQNNIYTAFSISFIGSTLEWTMQKTWKTRTRPLDLVHSKKKELVFVLEEDHAVHIYSFFGEQLGSIPVNPGTVAVEMVPRKSLLYLIDRNNTYTALRIVL